MKWLKLFDPKGTLRQLILEDTFAARTAMEMYKSGKKTGEADAMLFKSILATIELHKSGATAALMGVTERRDLTKEEVALLQVAMKPYQEGNKQWLIEQYGLTKMEVHAIEAYSLPNKDKKDSPHYMGPGKWDPFKDGWEALASAMKKLPSLGQLELEVTTYRAPREKSETAALEKLAPETNVAHGIAEMGMGQKHYMSTALTYNVHSDRAEDVGGISAISGKSGVLINPFGAQGILDGGEILYPPDIATRFEGKKPEGYKGKKKDVPVFHMKEVVKSETGQGIVEDKDFKPLKARHPKLDAAKLDLIGRMELIVGKHGAEVLDSARSATGIHGEIMYLTIDDLETLTARLGHEVSKKKILDLYPK